MIPRGRMWFLSVPTDGIPVFYEEGAGEVTLAPAEGPRYLLESAGRRYPVNEYGS